MTKHTQGEWEARGTLVKTPPTKPEFKDNLGVTFRRICVCEPSPYMGEEECEANARLIAAAPELLASLKEMIGYVEGDYTGSNGKDLTGGRLTAARAVVAKATGKTP